MIVWFIFVFITALVTNLSALHKYEKDCEFQRCFKIDGTCYAFLRTESPRKELQLREKFANGRKIEPVGKNECATHLIDNDTFETGTIFYMMTRSVLK